MGHELHSNKAIPLLIRTMFVFVWYVLKRKEEL